MEKTKIDLVISRFSKKHDNLVKNLVTYENGKNEAVRLNIIENARNFDIVLIEFPDEIDSVSPSYMKGLLEELYKDIGKTAFGEKIRFIGSPYVIRWIGIGLRNFSKN